MYNSFSLVNYSVDDIDSYALSYVKQDKVLSFHCGFNTAFRQKLEICGSKKSILIDNFVIPAGGKAGYTLSSSGLTNYAALAFDELDVVDCGNEHVQVSLTSMELGNLFCFYCSTLLLLVFISNGK